MPLLNSLAAQRSHLDSSSTPAVTDTKVYLAPPTPSPLTPDTLFRGNTSSPRCDRHWGHEKGLTILEIIIVIALLGSLMVYLITNLTGVSEGAKEDQARLAMGNISQSLQMYRVHNHRLPTTDQGLDALITNPSDTRTWRGPYIEQKKLIDPWGNPFSYELAGRDFRIISPGYDGVVGNEDDISFPDDAPSEGTE